MILVRVIDRAYSLLTIKAIDPARREFEGIASTPEPDRLGDVVVPEGAVFSLPIPLLWQHDKTKPIGEVIAASVTPAGIAVRARVADLETPGLLRDRLNEAWDSITAGLVKGLSLGFQALEAVPIGGKSLGLRFVKWAWIELSAVTIPANAAASITAIKAACTDGPALRSGERAAGVAATTATKARANMATYKEQIATFEAAQAVRAARQAELMTAAGEKGETLDGAAGEEYETLKSEIRDVTKHLERLREMDAASMTAARPVAGVTPEAAAASRAPVSAGTGAIVVRSVDDRDSRGLGFARVALCRAASYLTGGMRAPEIFAKERFGYDPRVLDYFRKAAAPVNAGTTLDPAWAGQLVFPNDLAAEFIEWVRAATIIGRMPGLTNVPFNVRVAQQTSGGAAYWTGEAKAKPMTAFAFGQQTMGITKLASITAISDELARLSSPSAEMVVRGQLAAVVQERMDTDFIDPANAGIVNVKPASITNGVAGIPSSGNDAAAVLADLLALLNPILAETGEAEKIVLIMSPATALALGVLRTPFGAPAFPGIGVTGGNLNGVPVIVTKLAGTNVIAVHAPSIWLADDGQVTVDASREASLEMSDAPGQDGATGTGASLVSMWQTNMLALRAERVVNWKKIRPAAVQFLTNVHWGAAA